MAAPEWIYEITQDDGLDGSSRMDIILDDFLVYLLGVAIGRKGFLNRSLFGDGQVLFAGLSVDGAAAREDDSLHIVFRHQLKKIQQRGDVVAIIEQRFLNALSHRLRSCEVDNALDVGIFLEHSFQALQVAAVHLLECGAYARDAFNTVDAVGR